MTYQGHMPDGDGVQRHSAGDIYPVIIVHYGDGSSRWVDQRLGRASERRVRSNPEWSIQDYAGCYFDARQGEWPADFTEYYAEFLREFRPE